MRRILSFAGRVVKNFFKSRGLLLASAIAYNTLLSVIPFFILVLVVLSHVIDQSYLLDTIRDYLRFIVPGQATAVMAQIDAFLVTRRVIGAVGLVAMLFFSGMAFSMLEASLSVIFSHRTLPRQRHFLTSVFLPYLFVVSLSVAILCVTLVHAVLTTLGQQHMVLLGWTWSLSSFSSAVIYILDLGGITVVISIFYYVMPPGRTAPRDALLGGLLVTLLWEGVRRLLTWYFVRLSSVDAIYGSAATAVIVLSGFEVAAIILLLVAEVIAEVERIGNRDPNLAAKDK